jgi:membrane-associated phospholipid phosphatase
MGEIMENTVKKENTSFKILKNNLIALCTMLLLAPLNTFYLILNNSQRGAYNLTTPLDDAIPFVKEFIVPYVAWYGFIFLVMTYLCFKDRRTYYITLTCYALGLTSSFITFYFFQTTVPRPEVMGSDIFSKMVLQIYGADQPYNCFPSIHVLTSFLMVKAVSASTFRNKTNLLAVWFCAVMIIISTLFVKQHVILDAVSGVIYADLIFRLVNAYGENVWNFLKKQVVVLGFKKKLEAKV